MGAAVVAPLLALLLWFAAAPANRCSLYQNLGSVYLAKGTLASRANLATAVRIFTSPLLSECRSAAVTYGLGQAYARLGQAPAAIAALQSGTGRADLRHLALSKIYEETGRPDDAWFEYGKLPRDAAAYFYRLADQADRWGDTDRALHYLSVATMINPAYPKADYRTALIYWRRLGDQDQAAALIRRALAIDTKPSVERDFYQGLLCYYEDQTNCAVATWMSAVRETARVDPDANTRLLAYQMLSVALYEHGPASAWRLAFLDRGAAQ